MSAKDATLEKTGSHWVADDGSSHADGISKEEVYFYFSATWRGQPVQVEVSADRYAYHGGGITDWRVYARAARFYDPEKNGGRGNDTTDTARAALSKLCEPLATAWLGSDEYQASFQQALAHMIMRKFQDGYSASRRVTEALVTFGDRLSPANAAAIYECLAAFDAYESAKAHAFEVIKGAE